MKKYLKTQQNQFGQSVGFLVERGVPSKAINQNLVGQYVKLIHIADGISDSAANQIWEAVSTEPNAACWTYLPYSAPQNRDILKDRLQNLFGFKGSAHFLIEVDGEIQGLTTVDRFFLMRTILRQ